MTEGRVQLILKLADGSDLWVSIAGVANYPDSSSETPEGTLAGMGCPGDEAMAQELLGATVIGAVDLDGGEMAARDQSAAFVRDEMKRLLDGE